jgi:hypothetical protein
MLLPPVAIATWSLFEQPLVRIYYPGRLDVVTLTFTLSSLMLGIFAFIGGVWMTRVVGVTGGVLYELGVFPAASPATICRSSTSPTG